MRRSGGIDMSGRAKGFGEKAKCGWVESYMRTAVRCEVFYQAMMYKVHKAHTNADSVQLKSG